MAHEDKTGDGIWICLDIGSTWTKATAVDPLALRILGTARARTTAHTDVGSGVSDALTRLAPQIGNRPVASRLACSSAAGGLRMVAVGLVPELTAEAARRAAFSAGAKVIRTFAHELTRTDLRELEAIVPDIVLLCGGTDGGNRRVLLHNAAALAGAAGSFPVVLAGNRSVADEAAALLAAGGKPVRVTENVMPEFNRLNLEPAREAIRAVFLERIIHAKGLDRLIPQLDGLLMPTPFAVLNAVRLLAQGHGGEPGLGDLLAVDLGGATTDIYSMASGEPAQAGVVWKGLPEPYAKRTVEGDLGVRYNAHAIVDTCGPGDEAIRMLADMAGASVPEAQAWLAEIDRRPDVLPSDLNTTEQTDPYATALPEADPSRAPARTARLSSDVATRLDAALSSQAIGTALRRHAGTLEESFTPMGRVFLQNGKDLTAVHTLLLTGGPLTAAADPAGIGFAALRCAHAPSPPQPPSHAEPDAHSPSPPHTGPAVLLPERVGLLLDKRYILAAMGLLAEEHPGAALRILKQELLALASCHPEATTAARTKGDETP